MTSIFSLLTLPLLFVPAIANGQTMPFSNPWSYTVEEMELAFRYQQQFGANVSNRLGDEPCILGKKETTGSYEGKQLSVPCRFIDETVRHLEEMLKKGAAKYIFRLDAGHAHFVLPQKLWKNKYSKLTGFNRLRSLLREPDLAALYHTAEFLSILNRKTGKINPQAKSWKDKRNVLAFYDGRPIEILPPDPTGAGVGPPANYEILNKFNFIANPRGLFVIVHQGKTIYFDITFEELSSAVLVKKPINRAASR